MSNGHLFTFHPLCGCVRKSLDMLTDDDGDKVNDELMTVWIERYTFALNGESKLAKIFDDDGEIPRWRPSVR